MDFGKAPFHFWAIRFDALSNTDCRGKNSIRILPNGSFPGCTTQPWGGSPSARPPPYRVLPDTRGCDSRGFASVDIERRKIRALHVYAEGAIAAAGYGAA